MHVHEVPVLLYVTMRDNINKMTSLLLTVLNLQIRGEDREGGLWQAPEALVFKLLEINC